MKSDSNDGPRPSGSRVLGIDGGGTKTEWLLAEVGADGVMAPVARGRVAAGNLKLSTDRELREMFSVLPREVGRVGVFLAGCATEGDRERLRGLAAAVWPAAEIAVGSDRDSALATAFREGDGIVIMGGTGAAVHGRREGKIERAGGWGQVLGDRGSGYDLAVQALRSVLSQYDLTGEVPELAQSILRTLALNRLHDLVDWVSQADKMSVARLAPVVFEAAQNGNTEMIGIVDRGAATLAGFAEAVARRLGGGALRVRLFGGLFVYHPLYVEAVRRRLGEMLPGYEVGVCLESGAMGAAWLAGDGAWTGTDGHGLARTSVDADGLVGIDRSELAAAATEGRNPRSGDLEALSALGLVDLFVAEEEYVGAALGAVRERIAEGIELVAERLREGGRLFYVGAGSSGRIGVLDASEIPPTFGASPELVQGIIAGGAAALHRAVEGAEDQLEAGALALAQRGVRAGDVVCGLTASGRTPFVLGALAAARRLGARTMLVSCNPSRRREGTAWDVEIDLPTGPELVTGSTRLKAGTATKLAVNLLSTGAMIRLGKVRGNAMVDVQISNEKLRDRGARLVSEALGVGYEEARGRLEAAGWSVREALGKEEG